MINKLYIKDFAILDEVDLSFSPGLTIITGETGSGKSIILQALNIALGGKASKTMVRTNQERSVVETQVTSETYRRIIFSSGRTKSFINDEPISEKDFRESVVSLVDFHGQHEQQLIMKEAAHIDYLDAYCGIADQAEQASKLFDSIRNNLRKVDEMMEKQKIARERKELLSFQLQEINSVDPQPEEDDELEKELRSLRHLDEIVETSNHLNTILTDDDNSIYNQISSASLDLDKLTVIDEKLEEYAKMIRSASLKVQEVSAGLSQYVNTLDHDKGRLIEIQDRLGALDSLKRKYGGAILAVIDTKKQIKNDLDGFSNLTSEIEAVTKQINKDKIDFQKLADKLHNKRIAGVSKLSKAVENEMLKLNMPGAKFEIQINHKEIDDSIVKKNNKYVSTTGSGYDIIRFLLSANPGERLKPLVEIASGGEISRIMLAIKTVFQNNDPVDVLVFDEIDSGISGVAAEKVANSLADLSKTKQVICITHLPQIAHKADNHLHITKKISNGITSVRIKYLETMARKKAIEQLSIGESVFN